MNKDNVYYLVIVMCCHALPVKYRASRGPTRTQSRVPSNGAVEVWMRSLQNARYHTTWPFETHFFPAYVQYKRYHEFHIDWNCSVRHIARIGKEGARGRFRAVWPLKLIGMRILTNENCIIWDLCSLRIRSKRHCVRCELCYMRTDRCNCPHFHATFFFRGWQADKHHRSSAMRCESRRRSFCWSY